jgi:biopolymer transport protein ExbD
MKIEVRSQKKARIEIIPMIDVIFFLLVFFMISSLAHEKFNSVSVNLPKTSSSPNAIKQKVILSIETSGNIYLNQNKITLSSLPDVLAHVMKDMPDETVIVNADQNVNYGLVMTVLDQVKSVGVRKFALLSKYDPKMPTQSGDQK